LGATAAELTYGETLRFPGEFLIHDRQRACEQTDFVSQLREHFRHIKPVQRTERGERKTFIFKELGTTSHVFVRREGPRSPLQSPYDGPYPVESRNEKHFVIIRNGQKVTVSANRLKPAYQAADLTSETQQPRQQIPGPDVRATTPVTRRVTRSGRQVRYPDRYVSCSSNSITRRGVL